MIDLTILASDCTCARGILTCQRHARVRPRWEIIRDYAAKHGLSVAETSELVAQLPGGSNNIVTFKQKEK